jgi:tetratricopeptide (TPR) repeat protein
MKASRRGWLLAGFGLLLINSAYLAAFAEASLFYAANVLLHLLLGVVLLVVAFFSAGDLFRPDLERGPLWRGASVALAVAALTGLYLAGAGNLSSARPILVTHVLSAILGAVGVAAALRRRGWLALVGAALLLPAGVELTGRATGAGNPPSFNQNLPPVGMEGEAMGGAAGPFFPSSAATREGKLIPAKFFMESETCAEAGCHPDIYQQWKSSAHHLASFNNQWYRKSVEYMQSVVGVTPSKWCGGCHDHALLFSGMMDTPIKDIIDRPEAHAGLSCTSCHSIVEVDDTMGNGGFVIEYPALHDLAVSENRWVRALHNFTLRLDPEPHRRTFLKPLHTDDTPTFCSSCHKVHLDKPVNHYRWIRGFNDYDNWQASGVSGEGARAFYYPPEPKTCKTCHMPLVSSTDAGNDGGKVHSHRFPAANTALPVAYQDQEQLETTIAFLRDNQVSIDLFALARGGAPRPPPGPQAAPERQIATTFAVGEEAEFAAPRRIGAPEPAREMIAPLDRAKPALARGESVRLDTVVRTRNVGHFFPGGTVDAFDVWVELKATDDRGKVVFWSGSVEDEGKGPVEPGAHLYRSLLLDARGNPINKRNAWAARSVLYVRLIPPGAADTVRFRLTVPKDAGKEIRFTAKLNYRKFAWWNTQWAYAGVRDPTQVDFAVSPDYDEGRWVFTGDTSEVSGPLKQIPDLPIVTLAEAEVVLPVVDRLPPPAPPPADPADALRWNDYGIGLFLQGDLRGAEGAFLKVTALKPDYADGWVNVARVRVQEGDPAGAQAMLDKALALEPNLAKAHYFYALSLKTEGRYDRALEHLERAAASFPRDRVVRNQIGRLHFLKREWDRAIAELQKTLRVDPEDLEAHYNLMLSYQGKGDLESAAHHQKLYLRFKADESSQFITGDYRRLHPADNIERQAIHEHENAATASYRGGAAK